MQKITTRCMIQNLIFRRLKRSELVLYNERPVTCTSLGIHTVDNKKFEKDEIKTIKSKNSRALLSFVAGYAVLDINPPVEDEINNEKVPEITLIDLMKLFAKTLDSSKDPSRPGPRLGRLDAANEAGFFHRTERSRLKNIIKKLKDKIEKEPTEPKKSG